MGHFQPIGVERVLSPRHSCSYDTQELTTTPSSLARVPEHTADLANGFDLQRPVISPV